MPRLLMTGGVMALDSWKDEESRVPVDMDREINFENTHALRLPIDQERNRLQQWAEAQERFRFDQGAMRKESALVTPPSPIRG